MADKEIKLPKGVAIWPKLEKPDTKFNPAGVYSVDIAVPVEEANTVIELLMAEYKAHTGKMPNKADNSMFKMEVDEETGDNTGRVIFKTKIKNVMRRDGGLWDRKPVLWDAKGNRIRNVNVGSGSILRLKCSIYLWDAAGKKGVSLQPTAVQVLDLKSFSTGEDFDFEVEEEGFEMVTSEGDYNESQEGDFEGGEENQADF